MIDVADSGRLRRESCAKKEKHCMTKPNNDQVSGTTAEVLENNSTSYNECGAS